MGSLFGGGSPTIITVPALPDYEDTNNVADVAQDWADEGVDPVPQTDDAQQKIDESREERGREGRKETVKVEEEEEVLTAAKVLTGN